MASSLPTCVTSSESQNNFEKLPDELLDLIVQAVGPKRSAYPFDYYEPERNRWLPCMLVCHRWYRITSAHLFRSIRLFAPHNTGSNGPDDEFVFLQFLKATPSFARRIQQLVFQYIPLSRFNLACVLQVLPQLQCLDLVSVWLEGSGQVHGDHKLERLLYTNPHGDNSSYFNHSIVDLLALFSEIGTLKVVNTNSDPHTPPHNGMAAESECIRKLQIYELEIHTYHSIYPPYLTVLHDLNVFRRLTCLTVKCSSPNTVRIIRQLLQFVGPTLNELKINSRSFADVASAREDNAPASILRGGLAACVVLHGFELSMSNKKEPSFGAGSLNGQVVANDWLFAIHVISALPVQRLERLSFRYRSGYWRRVGQGFDLLPWQSLREVCRRFVNISALQIDIIHTGEDEVVLAEYVRGEMQEFKDVLWQRKSDLVFACEKEGCRWYKKR